MAANVEEPDELIALAVTLSETADDIWDVDELIVAVFADFGIAAGV